MKNNSNLNESYDRIFYSLQKQVEINESLLGAVGAGVGGAASFTRSFIGQRGDFSKGREAGKNRGYDIANKYRAKFGLDPMKRGGGAPPPDTKPDVKPDISSGSGKIPDTYSDEEKTERAANQAAIAARRYQRGASGVQFNRDDLAKSIRRKRKSDAQLAGDAGYEPHQLGMLNRGQRAQLRSQHNRNLLATIEKDKATGKYESTYYGDMANLIRESFQLNEKKGPCWKGYEAVGMKMKGGRKVPNCVPKKK
jgi:hypothetical protein